MKRMLATLFAALLAPAVYASEVVQPLVAPAWLAEQAGRDDLVVLDIRSGTDGGPRALYEQGHIPGAIHSSYTDGGWRTTMDGVIAKLPPVNDLALLIGGLGIGNDDTVVIVATGTDSSDFGSAARVYWTFKVLGHDRVAILDGGHRAWVEGGLPLAKDDDRRMPTEFIVNFRPEMVGTTEQVAAAREQAVQLLDARPREQYLGRGKHPQARAAGTIPGALNLEEARMVRSGTSSPVDKNTVAALVRESGLDPERNTITFCNTGHWAATSWFVLSEIGGYDNVVMYDGSMVEWAASEDRPLQIERRGLGRLLQLFE